MKFQMKLLCAAALLGLLPQTAFATDEAAKSAPAPVTEYTANKAEKRLSGTFGGQRVNYTATVAEQVLKDDKGNPKAAIVTTTYIAEPNDPSRPVTFLFNGGPGSASLWLQLGAFGPKRVAIPSDAKDDGAPPYPILDNPDSLLDVTDLVFIDPVGTGFSHVIGDTKPSDYYGMDQDATSVAQVIRQWLSEHDRWNSPKFLGGESYGTTRSALVAGKLENDYNDVALNGVILISAILDFAAVWGDEGSDVSYVSYVPNMAAAALYHGKASAPSLEQFVAEARAFAIGPYATALLKGQALPETEKAAVRRDLARFSGLSEAYLDRANLRVSPDRYYKELLRDRGLTIGRLDARYTGVDIDNAGESPDNDPSFYGIDGGYTAAANDWFRRTLGYKTERDYSPIGGVGAWDWRPAGEGSVATYLNVAPTLGRAMRENSDLRVFVGQGYYDFATPFLAAEQSLNRPGIPQDRIAFEYYGSGHMMYVRDEDRQKLSRDVRAFIRAR
ncbi:peptidase S10 [Croceicoccus ponticola]|uniref:Peptidase S10 n=2 Tax=Croceicoccus ponticola TaxID=2217664 RepID=A0A437GV31_9SPHN|nr:peptidase S10 [Croceicoccus ponticola]